jgi:glycosyltransferase involved in cell wall biosynthesis
MVLAEAMACGKAIITTRSGSIPDVVGEAALLVDPYAPEQLAGALAELLNNTSRRAYLGFKASERAAELYDADIVAAQIKEIYEELLISN